MRGRLLAFAAAAVVTVAVAVVALPRETTGGGKPDEGQFTITVTPEMRHHSRILDTLYFAGTAYGLGMLLLILTTGLSRRLRDASQRVAKRPFLVAGLYFVFFSALLTLLEFPLSYYAGFAVPHQFDLSNQTFAAWLGDEAKAFAVSTLVGALIVALALLAIRRVRRWWLALWLGSLPLMVLLVVIAPIFFDPLFNKFEPLRDASLKQALLDEASRAGIEGSRVYQVDKSKQTKTMNAYVTGLGPTNRIVMWDTLLAKMNRDEILAVMGHEMGHYVLKHLWKGLAYGVGISLIICFLGQRIYEWGLGRWGSSWDVREPADPAGLPWLLLIAAVIGFLLSPVINGLSRRTEHQADIFGLELTHLNEAAASAFVKLAEDSKVDPNPHPFIEFWRYSHPSIARRVDFVLRYKPWEQGEQPKMWKQRSSVSSRPETKRSGRLGVSSAAVETAARATDAKIANDELIVHLVDGRTLSVPLVWFPRLLHASSEQRAMLRIIGDGEYLHWPDADEDLSVAGLLRGSRA